MSSILLFLHVATAILFMGPVMVSTSAFAPAAQKAAEGDTAQAGIARMLHRITQTYGYLSALVPLFGATLLFVDWETHGSNYMFHTALLLAIIAWIILLAVIIPKQKQFVGALGLLAPGEADASDKQIDPAKTKKQLSAFSGVFNLLWIIVLVLMYL